MFTCKCPRCCDPTELGTFLSAMKCLDGDCTDGYLLPSDSLDPDSDWICNASDQHARIKADNIREGDPC
jgi:hypothetical protein